MKLCIDRATIIATEVYRSLIKSMSVEFKHDRASAGPDRFDHQQRLNAGESELDRLSL